MGLGGELSSHEVCGCGWAECDTCIKGRGVTQRGGDSSASSAERKVAQKGKGSVGTPHVEGGVQVSLCEEGTGEKN